jgi:hypothetical protein
MSMKNSNDTIGSRNRDLPTCGAVPQPTALLRAPMCYITFQKSQLGYFEKCTQYANFNKNIELRTGYFILCSNI